ncbi:MAG: thiol-disulfide isomerase [Candidatus Solibacter usitatus]|nr:thiol-disulfide isomerase [Candidatus Solibacter usitatus]
MKFFHLTTLLVVSTAAMSGATTAKVNYSKHVAPILNKRCVECHRAGEAAPMTFTSYSEVRPWAKAMKAAVLSKKMPPWLADPKHGKFSNDRRLSPDEIETISAWADSGAPEGNPKDLPPAPTFVAGWNIGKPDLIIDLGKDFEVPAEGTVPYKYFTVDPGLKEDVWVEAAEARADKRSVVHHIIAFVMDSKENLSGTGGNLLVGWAPGDPPVIFQPGTAKLIRAGSKINFQMHYTPNGKPATDRSYIGLRFAKEPPKFRAITGRTINFGFKIPPGADNHEVAAAFTLKEDVHLTGFMPHMHVRGKDFKYTIVYPDGRSEVLLSVPNYDFNWQLSYQLPEPLFLPKGTKIDTVAHFDNSANNKYNPDPTKEVKWGDQTWEEMMIGWYDYTLPVTPKAPVATGGAEE